MKTLYREGESNEEASKEANEKAIHACCNCL